MSRNFDDGQQAKPGAALKALRTQRGWTLAEVSKRMGMPVSTLSKVENGKIALTFDKLLAISKALEVDVSQLFGPNGVELSRNENKTRRSITRAGEGKAINFPVGSYLYVNVDLLNKKMVPIIGVVRAKTLEEFGEMMHHAGEEYVYVVEGILEFHTQLYAPVRLQPGDSLYFDSDMRHAYVSVGQEPCRILSICATSESQLLQALEEKIGPLGDATTPVLESVAKLPRKRRVANS